jgi:hypothetical protein
MGGFLFAPTRSGLGRRATGRAPVAREQRAKAKCGNAGTICRLPDLIMVNLEMEAVRMSRSGNKAAKMVYRVFGPGLGDGACLRARSESEAIGVISGIFGLDVSDLRAAADIRVRLPPNTILQTPAKQSPTCLPLSQMRRPRQIHMGVSGSK